MRPPPQPWSAETGLASLTLPVMLWFTLVAVVVLIDVSGYLVAAARAQQLADAAALAGVSVHVGDGPGHAEGAASDVVAAAGARLERCGCGARDVEVEVSVEVPGLVIPRVAGASRVTATAQATLTEVRPGPRPDGPVAQPWGAAGR